MSNSGLGTEHVESASMSADGRYVAHGASGANPFFVAVRIRDMEKGTTREIADALGPVLSPAGSALAYVVVDPTTTVSSSRVRVIDLQTDAVLWEATVARSEDPFFSECSTPVPADMRWASPG